MPPPSAGDSWLAHRRFGVVIDAGSSGSRLLIYSWRDARTVRLEGGDFAQSLPKVEKGVENGEGWITKVEPGLSSFANDPDSIGKYLTPLLAHARTIIPPSLEPETPLFLLATAGMRLLAPEQQAEVLKSTCQFLKFHSHFRVDDPSPAGPCGTSVRIITGEEEGLFGWIAINYLMDGFTGSDEDRTTYGFLDMGGASTQIAFEPSKEEREQTKDLVEVRLRLLGGEEIHHQVFVTTWLGYGTNQARERYVAMSIDEYEKTRAKGTAEVILDPCLPKGLELTETPLHLGPAEPHTTTPHRLRGTGSFEQCMRRTDPLLNKDAPCPDSPCLFNGVHVPRIDFSVSHFIGVSEYWYSSDDAFGLGGPYDFVQYERAAADFCEREWAQIVREHESSSKPDSAAGVHWGKHGNKATLSRLQLQCFKSAWITNVLHEGIGMPRIMDPGGNVTSSDGDKVAAEAENKGLGPNTGNANPRPVFQSVDTVGDVAISWTLGKMVLEASKEVPPLDNMAKPIMDPLDDMPESKNSSIKPIRPPFLDFDAIEDKISHRLPAALTRQSLGFSPVGSMFYVVIAFVVLYLLLRLRTPLRSSLRRLRRALRRERDRLTEDYSLEEGLPRPSAVKSLRQIASWMSPRQPTSPFLASPRPTPLFTSPRLLSTPSLNSPRANGPSAMNASPLRADSPAFPDAYNSVPSSPVVPSYSTAYGNDRPNGKPAATFALARSRNASQTSLIPRPLSRMNSIDGDN